MSLRSKTTQFAFPVLASMTNNTLTNFTQITVYIPESSVTIKKAWVEVSMDDIITVTGGSLTTKTVDLRLAAVAYDTTTNSQTYAHTAENMSYFTTRDFTSHFTTNWTGTSMTCDVRLQINQSTGTTLGMVNVCCILYITYEYDDTSATQIKSVWIPLNAPVDDLPTSKTSHDTVPALDTYLPEASKTYRNIFVVAQSNLTQADTSDHTVTYELSSLGTHTTSSYEAALATDRWSRYVWNITSYITTNTTHTFNVHSSVANRNHTMQAWMVVTYEFNPSSSSSVMNCLMLRMDIAGQGGGPTIAEYQRGQIDFYVQESNVTFNRLACFLFWTNSGNETALAARVGSGSFIAYTNTGSGVVAGNKSLMIRNDSPTGITLGRGKNTVFMDVYSTGSTIRGGALGAFWIVNYTSDKHSSGTGVHNRTIMWPLYTEGTAGGGANLAISADAPSIPDEKYYVSNLGFRFDMMGQADGQGINIKVERLSGEGGLIMERLYSTSAQLDSEAGLNTFYFDAKSLYQRWAEDIDTDKLLIENPRRYFVANIGASPFFNALVMSLTTHGITYVVSGNITNSNGGIVNVNLHKYSGGERVMSTIRTGNGPYRFDWYDNTEFMYTTAYESNVYKGMSGSGLAS